MQPTHRSSRILQPAKLWFVYFSLFLALGLEYIPSGRVPGIPDWVPLVLAWFGMLSLADVFSVPIGPAYPYFHNIKLSMIFIIFIGGFYPVLTSAIHGVGLVPQTLTDAARVLGANQVDIFRKVLLPYAAPSIINGLRIGLGVSWMCLVSAEMLPGSLSGVGYLITHAYTVGRTDVVIAGMISIGLVGAVLDRIFRLYEDRKFVWKRLTK